MKNLEKLIRKAGEEDANVTSNKTKNELFRDVCLKKIFFKQENNHPFFFKIDSRHFSYPKLLFWLRDP